MPRPIFQRTQQTSRVIERLLRLHPTEVVPWSELTRLLGEDAQQAGRRYVDSARRILLAEHQLVFEPINGVGIQHLNDAQIMGLPEKMRGKIRRAARRGLKKMHCADLAKLSSEDVQEYRAASLEINLHLQFSGPRGYDSIKANVSVGQPTVTLPDGSMFEGA